MTRLKNFKWLLLVAFIVAVMLFGFQPKLVSISGPTMGTGYHVKFLTTSMFQSTNEIEQGITQILEQVNEEMSTYRQDSELSRFNQHDSTKPFELSNNTTTVVSEAIRLNLLTQGALDVTVGPLVNLWGFGPQGRPEKIPSNEEIESVRAITGVDKLLLIDNRLTKSEPKLYVDLSSIAKGHGTDRLADYLGSQGIENYMVEVGGEIRVKGNNDQGNPWRIAIEKPVSETRAIEMVIEPVDLAIATSGDYRNYFEKDGVRYSHIIDPKTAKPITNNVVSVTVLAPLSMTADGLATGLMVLGAEKGLEVANQHNIPVLFIIKTPSGFEEKASQAFLPYMNKTSKEAQK